MHMDRHLGLASPTPDDKAELLGLLGGLAPPPRKKPKTEKPVKKEKSNSDTPVTTPYSSMLASSSPASMLASTLSTSSMMGSSSSWSGFPLYPPHQGTPYPAMYPGNKLVSFSQQVSDIPLQEWCTPGWRGGGWGTAA